MNIKDESVNTSFKSYEIYKNLTEQQKLSLTRWRLILGEKAEDQGISNIAGDQFLGKNDPKMSNNQPKEAPKQNANTKGGMGTNPNASSSNSSNTRGQAGGKTSLNKTKVKTPSKQNYGRTNFKPSNAGGTHPSTGNQPMTTKFKDIDNTLNLVYNTAQEKRGANLASSRLSIPKWIENVKNLFPNKAKEVLENDLVKKSKIADLIKHPELFDKVEPNLEMVKTILSLKNMLSPNVKDVARRVVKKVVEQIKNQLKSEVERHIVGAIKRDSHTPVKVFRNIDWKQSIMRNLKHYDSKIHKLIMAEPRFFTNEKRRKAWQIIVLVDESGSMADSVIYSVIMASIFSSLPAIHTNLIIFDTQVVDLSKKIDDPVDILMSVQLGGGTDISKAVRYGRSLIKKPKKAIMVIISDFYEGRPVYDLIRALKEILEGGTKVLGIASLSSNAKPFYNKQLAKEIHQLGIDVIASTPESFPEILARLMNS
ncbi:MAG: VWA domain-containing protein [Promethearchaeota archaeon]